MLFIKQRIRSTIYIFPISVFSCLILVQAMENRETNTIINTNKTQSDLTEKTLDVNMWVPILNAKNSEATFYLDFYALDGFKQIKLPDNKIVKDKEIEYTCYKNGEYKFELEFNDGSIYERTINVKGIKNK